VKCQNINMYWVRNMVDLLAIATLLMALFVAYQAWATHKMVKQAQKQVGLTQQSIEEMRKERLTPIVIDAINALISIENKIKK